MQSKKLTIFIILILTVILFYLIYMSGSADQELAKKNKDVTTSAINFLINKMHLKIHDDDGSLKSTIASLEVKHLANEKVTKLNSPELKVNHENTTWDITSDSGKIVHSKQKIKKIEYVKLSENVKIIRTDPHSQTVPYITLETDKIYYYPEKNLITTKSMVKILTKDSETTAMGMQIDKDKQELTLLSNVVSNYQTVIETKSLKQYVN